jgi:hypothetical protein
LVVQKEKGERRGGNSNGSKINVMVPDMCNTTLWELDVCIGNETIVG